MFVGHEAVGLAGRGKTPWISLGTWLMAVQLLDLLWPLFLLLGWEHVRVAPGITKLCPFDFYDYPISHSPSPRRPPTCGRSPGAASSPAG